MIKQREVLLELPAFGHAGRPDYSCYELLFYNPRSQEYQAATHFDCKRLREAAWLKSSLFASGDPWLSFSYQFWRCQCCSLVLAISLSIPEVHKDKIVELADIREK